MSELCNKTTLVQQKQPNVPKHCNVNDQTVIHKLCIIYFFCVRRAFSLLYVQYDYIPSMIAEV